MKLIDIADRVFRLIDDRLDWIDAVVDRYSYTGRHRGVYDWNIGTIWNVELIVGDPARAEISFDAFLREYTVALQIPEGTPGPMN